MADLWTRSPEFLRGYAEAVRAVGQPVEAAVVAAVLEGFAARLDGVRVAAPAVVAVTPAPVMAAPLPELPPPALDAAPAVAPEKPKRKAQEWSEERRQRQREHMAALRAKGVTGGRKPKAALSVAPVIAEPPPTPEAMSDVPAEGIEHATAEAIEEWLVAALLAQGLAQAAIDERIVQMSERVLLNTANAQRRLAGLPEFVVMQEAA